jgi:hypothetical protein
MAKSNKALREARSPSNGPYRHQGRKGILRTVAKKMGRQHAQRFDRNEMRMKGRV